MTLAHTLPALLEEIRADRRDRGEPEEGTTATEAEMKRWARKVRQGTG